MSNKGYQKSLSAFVAFVLIVIMLAGCGTGETYERSFCGVWDYPESGVRLQIFDDDSWEMVDYDGAVLAGGNCVIDGETAELYYTFGSPWENEDGPVMYNVLHLGKKGKLTDAVGESLFLTDETPKKTDGQL